MALLVPDAGEVKMAEMALKDASPGNQTLRLFVNDKTPAEGDTIASYTEMTTQGYAAITVERSGWSASSAGGVTTIQNVLKTFTFNGTGGDTTVYGYYLTTNDGTEKILWVQRFANAITVRNDGDQIKLTPAIDFE